MKRFRTPKLKNGELRVYWGKLPHDSPDAAATSRATIRLNVRACSPSILGALSGPRLLQARCWKPSNASARRGVKDVKMGIRRFPAR